MNTHFEVNQKKLSDTRVVTDELPTPAKGEVLMRVDSFALTANNITYGVAGDSIGYWKFFPAQGGYEGGWGRIPVWGFGEVIESTVDGMAVGDRFYGYYPMSSHLLVRPERVSKYGFTDGAAHRAALPAVYNNYTRNSTDPSYKPELEAMQMLFRPLFMTSFFLDDFLDDNNFFGAKTVVLASASSKTAFGLAWLLHRNRKDKCRVVGLTSPGNVDFVKSLGCYDEVVTYDNIKSLTQEPVVLVDMAGNATLRHDLHHHFKDNMRYSCSVGATHWEEARMGGNAPLPGAKPAMFFAPSQIQKRSKEWGAQGVNQRTGEAWVPFVELAKGWVDVQKGEGTDAVAAVYADVLGNKAKPSDGFILRVEPL